jgi:hypothetical protein
MDGPAGKQANCAWLFSLMFFTAAADLIAGR